MPTFLDFEKPIAELEGKIEELRHLSDQGEMNIAEEVGKLQAKADRLLRQTYAKLTAWQKAQVARHPERPHFTDYVGKLIEEFTPLAGDRAYAEDQAILGGLGRFRGRAVMVIGHEKGADTASRLRHNFGMARPEGYRKAQRLMELADRFRLPVITLIDTPGAYPGVDAEARGQAEAIARCDRDLPQDPRAAGGRGDRRGRLGRRHRARRRQRRLDAGACRLFGDLARGLRLDPVAQRRAGAGGGRGAQAHRRRTC
jgi:acetyl-CoA carboxylase carboxyl transferase alpha subunit